MQHADSRRLLLSPELLTAQESVSRALDRPCPFCHRDYEDTFEMQQHVAGHLEAMALLSIPNLDEDKESGKGNSNSANTNCAESKAGDFDFTEVLIFPENEGPDELRSSSEAKRREFKRKLGVLNQSFNKASNVVASYLEAMARLSVQNLDEEKESGEGDSISANKNRAESKAGEFDFTEVLVFPENEGPDELRSSTEAERREFNMKLGILNQSYDIEESKWSLLDDFLKESG